MKAIIGSDEDEFILLKYSEVASWFGVPGGHILTRIFVDSWYVKGWLREINKIKLNEVVISKSDEDSITILKELESFKKRFNLTEIFDVGLVVLIPEDNNRVEEIHYSIQEDEINHYLKARPNDVYFKTKENHLRTQHCFKILES